MRHVFHTMIVGPVVVAGLLVPGLAGVAGAGRSPASSVPTTVPCRPPDGSSTTSTTRPCITRAESRRMAHEGPVADRYPWDGLAPVHTRTFDAGGPVCSDDWFLRFGLRVGGGPTGR